MSRITLAPNVSGTGTLTVAAPNTNTDRTITLPDATGTVIYSDTSGNVGVGVTANAAIKLDVNGPIASRSALTVDQTSAAILNYSGIATQIISYGSAVTGGVMDFYTGLGGATPPLRMRVDDSGNVGINTSTPSKKLEVYASSASLQINSIVKNDTAGAGVAAIGFNVSSSAAGEATSTKAGIGLQRNFAFGGGFLCFYNNNSGVAGDFTTADERMRIDGSGVVTINNLAGAGLRSVTASPTGVLAAASDSRLKQEVPEAYIAGLAEIMQLRPVAYKWLDDIANRGDDAAVELGFFADEAKDIIPSAAPMGNDGYYGFYDRSVIAALTKAVQEQQQMIQALQADIAALKGV